MKVKVDNTFRNQLVKDDDAEITEKSDQAESLTGM
jgi:hypothetical protein